MGGPGEEREISLQSGKAIQLALEAIGYNVLGITMKNKLTLSKTILWVLLLVKMERSKDFWNP